MSPNVRRQALVTGATSGFGYEFCKLLAGDGYNLVMVARSDEQLHRVAAEIAQLCNIEVRCINENLFRPGAAQRVYQQTRAWNLQIDVLINNANRAEHGRFLEYELERDIDLIQLNIISVIALTKLFLSDMVARNDGKILNVSSLLAKYPTPLMTVYAATKAFILSFSEALTSELSETNVVMTVLLAGAVDTDFFHKTRGPESKVYPERSLSDPAQVARDGYAALKRSDRYVILGLKNKIQAVASSVLPDSAVASVMRKQMGPDHDTRRKRISHPHSRRQGRRIQGETGRSVGGLDRDEGGMPGDDK